MEPSQTRLHRLNNTLLLHMQTHAWPAATLQKMRDNTHLVEFDDMGVVQQLHNLHLSVDFLQVGGVQSGLVNYLNGHLEKPKAKLLKMIISKIMHLKYSHTIRRRAADLCFGDFVFGQFHHRKVPLPQGADDLVEADLQGPPLGRAGLSPPAALGHDHHGAPTVWSYSAGTV